jgi:hypothetical protein
MAESVEGCGGLLRVSTLFPVFLSASELEEKPGNEDKPSIP